MIIKPITKEAHKDWSYVGLSNYLHTKNDAIVPIVIAEISHLVTTNPIAFVEQDGMYSMYSLQSIMPNQNYMIDSQGTWLNNYIPARYRSLPFVFAVDNNSKQNNEKILCYIEDLGCVAKKFTNKSTKIFSNGDKLSAEMEKVFSFLQNIENNEAITKKALLSIQELDLFEDWKISLKLADGEKEMNGLKKVDFEKVKKLTSSQLEMLNKTGGLDICYASYFSITNLDKLRDLMISKVNEIKGKQKTKSIRDKTIEMQQLEKKQEMDNLVKDLLLED